MYKEILKFRLSLNYIIEKSQLCRKAQLQLFHSVFWELSKEPMLDKL